MGKKLLKICMSLTLAVLLGLSAIACGGAKWKGELTLTTPGEVKSNGGFAVETANYVYYINGSESYTAENKFGTPVKGAIMACEKAKLGKDDLVSQIVVPSVVSSGDYNAGIYVYGGSIYYATPSTKKDTTGNVVNEYIQFSSMTLDGTNKVTEYLTVKGNATEFRIVEKESVVYIVYYSSEDSAIVSYNTKTKQSLTVVESPASYKFVENAAINDAVVLYTVNGKDQNGDDDTSYNTVYAYVAGAESATCLYEGNKNAEGQEVAVGTTYAISFVKGEYVFYTATLANDTANAKTYGNTVKGFVAKTGAKLYEKTTYAVEGTLFIDLDTAYVSEDSLIKKITTTTKQFDTKEAIQSSNVSTLLFVKGDYIYYVNSSSELARINITDVEKEEERLSESTVNTTWYDIKLVGDFVMYLDNTTYGANYVYYVDVKAVAVGEDTDDDGEDDKWYVEKVNFLGRLSDADEVLRVTTKIGELSSITAFTIDEEDKLNEKEQINEVKAMYDALSESQKKEVSEEQVALINKYLEYVKVNELLVQFKKDYLGDNDNIKVVVSNDNKAEIQAKIDAIMKIIDDNGFVQADTNLFVENGMWAVSTLQEKIDDLAENK